MPRSRMNDHSLGLIDHQNILIFVQNVQRDVLRQYIRYDLFGKNKTDLVIFENFCTRFRCFAV